LRKSRSPQANATPSGICQQQRNVAKSQWVKLPAPTNSMACVRMQWDAQTMGSVDREDGVVGSGIQNGTDEIAMDPTWTDDRYRNERSSAPAKSDGDGGPDVIENGPIWLISRRLRRRFEICPLRIQRAGRPADCGNDSSLRIGFSTPAPVLLHGRRGRVILACRMARVPDHRLGNFSFLDCW
jgi:hypothetical protein